jgi:hypothetical protein
MRYNFFKYLSNSFAFFYIIQLISILDEIIDILISNDYEIHHFVSSKNVHQFQISIITIYVK